VGEEEPPHAGGLRARLGVHRRLAPEAQPAALSHTLVNHITTELCEQFYRHLEETVSPRERWRAFKAFKILLADAAVRLRLGYVSPADKLENPQPAGRAAIWLGAEIEDMAAGAAIAGFEGMSLAIETAWESMFSPVDVRTLLPARFTAEAGRWLLPGPRPHQDRQGGLRGALRPAGRRTGRLPRRQGRNEADDTPIFRQRDGEAYRTRTPSPGDFRDVRSFMFPGDTRQLLDIRRSANVEADAAGADKKTMGELLANGLADSKFLEETYTPPTVAKAREVAAQRVQGRAKLAGEV
jgi:hypothetical protein